MGLQGLTRALSSRTALDPGEPIGIDLARDELAFYPLLYWPMTPNRPAPSEAAIRKVDAFMKGGGTIVFDTRDALNNRGGNSVTPETQYMRRILQGIDVPDLEPVPKDHVVTKTFYNPRQFRRPLCGRADLDRGAAAQQEQDRTRPAQARPASRRSSSPATTSPQPGRLTGSASRASRWCRASRGSANSPSAAASTS